jgi:hypothetical protein
MRSRNIKRKWSSEEQIIAILKDDLRPEALPAMGRVLGLMSWLQAAIAASLNRSANSFGVPRPRLTVAPCERWAHQNRQGSIATLTNASGQLVERYRYGPYGQVGAEGAT